MKKAAIIFLSLFIIVSIGDLIAVSQGWLRYLTKPMILLTLMTYYFIVAKNQNKFNRLFFIAMIFAWLGDVLLMFDGFFVLGLSSFLAMQLLYAFIFFKEKGDLHWYKILFAIALITVGVLLAYRIIPIAADFKIPVIAYSVCISLMGIAGAIRKDLPGYWIVFAGIVSFIFSDSLLGINMFDGPIKYGGIGVMFSYILAQFLIVTGLLKQ